MVVVDASAILAVVFDESPAEEAAALLELIMRDGALVPALWDLEVGNALLSAERRGRLSAADTDRALNLLAGLPVELAEIDPSMPTLLACARQYGLTTYDAAYLLLAMQGGLALATRDARLAEAASSAGVPLV
ncbi:MAG: type II toxin-antitoxin system VapC family toxin [Propionibacteriaceae bacterium]|nr:type II toxin-antitoxin system VapC family toxin [Propionibacteriaceae bacterium]